MTRRKLARIRRRLEQLRSRPANVRSRELVALARRLGRRRYKRGKEPTYINEDLPHRRPLSIPSHAGTLNRYTAGNILDQLELDVLSWEQILEEREGTNDQAS